jgi:hypothetical protein
VIEEPVATTEPVEAAEEEEAAETEEEATEAAESNPEEEVAEEGPEADKLAYRAVPSLFSEERCRTATFAGTHTRYFPTERYASHSLGVCTGISTEWLQETSNGSTFS